MGEFRNPIKIYDMTTIEILLLIIAIAEVGGIALGFYNSSANKAFAKTANRLNDDIRFQRDIAQTNYKNWDKARLENAILREQLNGTAYKAFKSMLEKELKTAEQDKTADKYIDGRRDILNEVLERMNSWETQHESND